MRGYFQIVMALTLVLLASAARAWVTEQEPNNTAAQANVVACGDTVLCARIGVLPDVDCFRFHVEARDSIVAFTANCAGSQTNTLMVLYTAGDSMLAVNDNGGEMEFSRLVWRAATTGDYVLRVHRLSGSGADSTYNLVVNCPRYLPEDYDLCTTPRVIGALPYFDENGSTMGATHQCGSPSPDVFYQFYNPVTCNMVLEVCTDEFDARVQILGRCCGDYWDDENIGCDSGATLTSYGLAPGTYFILVEGRNASSYGHFSLEVYAQTPACPAPGPLVVATAVGNYPLLDWPQATGPAYYVVWYSHSPGGLWEHLGTTPFTYFVDSTGYGYTRKFYRVTAVCPWSGTGNGGR